MLLRGPMMSEYWPVWLGTGLGWGLRSLLIFDVVLMNVNRGSCCKRKNVKMDCQDEVIDYMVSVLTVPLFK